MPLKHLQIRFGSQGDGGGKSNAKTRNRRPAVLVDAVLVHIASPYIVGQTLSELGQLRSNLNFFFGEGGLARGARRTRGSLLAAFASLA